MRLPSLRKLGLVISLIAFLAACQPAPASTPKPTTAALPPTLTPNPTPLIEQRAEVLDPTTQATVRFVTTIPNAPRMDVYVGTTLSAPQLGYGVLSSVITKSAGKYMVRIVRTGDVPGSDNLLLQEPLSLDAHEAVLFVLTGKPDKIAFNRFVENLDPLEAGQTRVQVIHAMADEDTVSAVVGAQKLGPLAHSGQIADPIVAKPGQTDFRINSGDTSVFSQAIPLQDRQSYTLIITGSIRTSVALTIANSTSQRTARVRIINASPDTGPVDVYLGDKAVGTNLAPRKFGDWQTVPIYSTRLQIFKAGNKTSPLVTNDLALRADQSGSIVLYEPASQLQSRIFWENLRPTAPQTARLSVINVAKGTSAVQVLSAAKPLVGMTPVRYADLGLSSTIPVGSLKLSFSAGNEDKDRVVEEPASNIDFAEGIAYLYVVTGEKSAPLLLSVKVGVEQPQSIPTATSTPVPPDVMQVRLINATKDLDALDAYAGKIPLYRLVRRGQMNKVFASITETNNVVRLVMPNTDRLLTQSQLKFQAGQTITLVAAGRMNNDLQLVQGVDADVPLDPGTAQIQAAHIAPLIAPLTIEAAAPGELKTPEVATRAATASRTTTPLPDVKGQVVIDRVNTSTLSAVAKLNPGTYTFLARSAAGAIVARSADVKVEPAKRYIVVVMADGDKAQLDVVTIESK